jgi:hypothetical protein
MFAKLWLTARTETVAADIPLSALRNTDASDMN